MEAIKLDLWWWLCDGFTVKMGDKLTGRSEKEKKGKRKGNKGINDLGINPNQFTIERTKSHTNIFNKNENTHRGG